MGGWLGAYSRLRQDREGWHRAIEESTRQLWQVVMGSVAEVLTPSPQDERGEREEEAPVVTLIATGLLGLLPLHAAWTQAGEGRRYFLDDFAVAYAPSALALDHARSRAAAVEGEHLLAVGEPQPVSAIPLPNTLREVGAIVDLFDDVQTLHGRAATHTAVMEALPAARLLHFSGHGGTDWQNPRQSGLLLAHDRMLTVADVQAMRHPGARLATLSACETGIPGRQLPDEVVNLASALVQTGFAGVASSLWAVYDISTAMLMERFYRCWREEGLAPVHALRRAQIWIRDTTNQEKADYFAQEFDERTTERMADAIAVEFFSKVSLQRGKMEDRSFAHPAWWAAFTFTGV
ncbi:MAG: CHAT domain-containing protein [Caldilineaceae bacterium]|nr:CHAT domain-containing protein [Caldilineaceae bacterium]